MVARVVSRVRCAARPRGRGQGSPGDEASAEVMASATLSASFRATGWDADTLAQPVYPTSPALGYRVPFAPGWSDLLDPLWDMRMLVHVGASFALHAALFAVLAFHMA